MGLEYPIYVLVGSEPVQRRHMLSRLREQSGSWERVQAESIGPAELLQPSLFANAESPLVRVIEGYSSWKPAQRKQLAQSLDQLGQGLNLIVCVDRLGAKDPLRAALDDKAVVALPAPKRGGFEKWLANHARLSGVPLDKAAAAAMVANIGENTEALAAELARLAGAFEKVDSQLIEKFTDKRHESQAWGFVDAVIEGSSQGGQLAECEASNLEPLLLLGALSKRLCLISWVQIADQESAGAADYSWRLARQAAKRWPRERLTEALSQVAKAEQQMKGLSGLSGYTILARLQAELGYSPSSKT